MEILNNTILKVIYRQGSNDDRKHVVFSSGEPAYTNDTERLYIGNSVLSGGNPASILYAGTTSDVTTLSTSEINDLSFDSVTNKLYRKETSTYNLSSWENIGGIYTTIDAHLSVDGFNRFSLNPLSANKISDDAVSDMIVINSGRIALSSNIPYERVSTKTITLSSGLLGYNQDGLVEGGFNPLSGDVVIRNNRVMAKYDSVGVSFTLEDNTTLASRLSAGHYRIEFMPTSNNYIPIVQTLNNLDIYLHPRVISPTISSCNVVILSSNSVPVDQDFVFKIDY